MSDVTWINSEIEFIAAVDGGGRVVAEFTAPAWCRPCQQFAPHYERAAEQLKSVKFLAVDVDNNDWAMLKYGVQGVPTVMLFENGEFITNIPAPQGALPFINNIQSA